MTESPSPRTAWRTVAAGAAGLAILLLLHSHGHTLIQVKSMAVVVWLVAAAALAEGWRRRAADGERIDPALWPGLALAAGLGLILFSSAPNNAHFFLRSWRVGDGWVGWLLASRPAKWMVAAALLTPLFLIIRRRRALLLLLLLAGLAVLCWQGYLRATSLGPVYGDDHPSFMFRLWVFGQSFPQLGSYIPQWNGGRTAGHVVSSGAVSIGLLLWPLWRFGDILEMYRLAIPLVFLGVVPLLAVFCTRAVGGSWTAGFAAGILSLGVSRFSFLWLLNFGTIASSTCAVFIIPLATALYRALWLDKRDALTAGLLVFSAFIFVAWPASAIMSAALLLGVLASARAWSKPRLFFLAGCAVILGLLLIPSVLTVLHLSDIGGFARLNPSKSWSLVQAVGEGISELRDHLRRANPILTVFGCVGVWFLPQRGIRPFFGASLLGLAFLAGWGETWKPQYSLSRAGIPMLYLACLPAGLWLGRIFDSRSLRLAPVQAALWVLLAFGGREVVRIYANREPPPYRAYSREIADLTAWIRSHVPEGGRLLFAGATVHSVGGGHVAVLPAVTGREMMACDYYHFSPAKVEYEYPPRPYRASPEGMHQFFELYNVTHVATYRPNWLHFFRSRPDEYEEVLTFGTKTKKTIFRVNREPSMFLVGDGSVRAEVNRIRVEPAHPDADLVIKYNWAEGLTTDPGVEIYPHEAGPGVRLIGVRPHGRTSVTIAYNRWF
jgi:hypothetical protein